ATVRWWPATVFSSSWVYVDSNLSGLSSNAVYRTFVRGLDNAGNVPANPNFGTAGVVFHIDKTIPVSRVTSPSTAGISYLQNGLSIFRAPADDFAGGSGLSEVRFRLRRTFDNFFYNPNNSQWENTPEAQDFPFPADPPLTTWSKVLTP